MSLTPICLFTYNRLGETKQTIEALQKNNLATESELYVFSDGPKNEHTALQITEIRNYLKTVKGFKNVVIYESKVNKGLATSIITGVSKMFEFYDSVIILEDDLITTSNFLDFMNTALEYYKNDDGIYTVNGYSPMIKNMELDSYYLHSRSFPWGWATWKNSWNEEYFDKDRIREYISKEPKILNEFDKHIGGDASEMLLRTLDNKISSWYIRWVFHNYLQNKKSIFPVLSKVQNIGDTEDATHYAGGISAYQSIEDKVCSSSFNFEKTIELPKTDYRFLKYFSKKYKFLYRLKLATSLKGFKQITIEIRTKFFK